MTKRRFAAWTTVVVVAVAACGGGGGGGQEQTEEGAAEAVASANKGALTGNAGPVLNFLNAECREAVDDDDVRLAVGLAQGFLGDLLDGVDADDVVVQTDVVSYDGDTARVEVSYAGPDGQSFDDGLFLSDETFDVRYEDGKWVDTDCDFEDTSEAEANAIDEGLAEIGFAGTREDPIPAGVAAPVGSGFVVSVDAVDPDARAGLEASGAFVAEPEAGEQFVLVSLTVGFSGPDEPASISSLTGTIVGGANQIGFDAFGCGSFDTQLSSSGRSLFTGGVFEGDMCFVVPGDEIPGMLLQLEGGFVERTILFDPTATAPSPVPVPSTSGPSPDGEFTEARRAPSPLGEPVALGEGWTITVRGFEPDATAAILAASEFNEPPPDGSVYGLLDYELSYDGSDEPASAFAVEVDLVGDSNVAADASCNVSEVPDELDKFTDVFAGGSIGGNVCYVVDAADLDSIVVFANADFFSDDASVIAVR